MLTRAERPDWQWFESRMTYANAVLPHALFIAARRWPQEDFLDIAQASFAFLDHHTTTANADLACLLAGRERGLVSPRRGKGDLRSTARGSGHDGRSRTGRVDLLGGEEYLAVFRRAHGWFHGRNSLKRPLVDVQSGACCDGLQASGVNRNQGAESTLAYLWTEISKMEATPLNAFTAAAAAVCPMKLVSRLPASEFA